MMDNGKFEKAVESGEAISVFPFFSSSVLKITRSPLKFIFKDSTEDVFKIQKLLVLANHLI
jgi:hypothetical protein